MSLWRIFLIGNFSELNSWTFSNTCESLAVLTSNTQMRKFFLVFLYIFSRYKSPSNISPFFSVDEVFFCCTQSHVVVISKKKGGNWTRSEGKIESPNRLRKARTKYSGCAPLRQGSAITVWLFAKCCRHSNSMTALHGPTIPIASSFFLRLRSVVNNCMP